MFLFYLSALYLPLSGNVFQDFISFFNLFFQATANPHVSGQPVGNGKPPTERGLQFYRWPLNGSSTVMSSRVKLCLQVVLKITPVSVLKHFLKIR